MLIETFGAWGKQYKSITLLSWQIFNIVPIIRGLSVLGTIYEDVFRRVKMGKVAVIVTFMQSGSAQCSRGRIWKRWKLCSPNNMTSLPNNDLFASIIWAWNFYRWPCIDPKNSIFWNGKSNKGKLLFTTWKNLARRALMENCQPRTANLAHLFLVQQR